MIIDVEKKVCLARREIWSSLRMDFRPSAETEGWNEGIREKTRERKKAGPSLLCLHWRVTKWSMKYCTGVERTHLKFDHFCIWSKSGRRHKGWNYLGQRLTGQVKWAWGRWAWVSGRSVREKKQAAHGLLLLGVQCECCCTLCISKANQNPPLVLSHCPFRK